MITHREIAEIVVRTVVVIAILTGCAAPHYGHTKEKWAALTDEQREAAKAKYAEILKVKEGMTHDDLIERSKQRVIERGVRGVP